MVPQYHDQKIVNGTSIEMEGRCKAAFFILLKKNLKGAAAKILI